LQDRDIFTLIVIYNNQSQWLRNLRYGSAASRLLKLWVRIPSEHGGLSVVSVRCCQVEVSATSWSFVQRSPTHCVLVCDLETSWMRRPWPTRVCCAKKKLHNCYRGLQTQWVSK